MKKTQRPLISELAKSTGVAEDDVAKVLEELGLSRTLAEVERLKQGHVVNKADMRIALRVGRTNVMM